MKKYFIALNLLALILLISSCEDIVDADNNILKRKINYHTVIADQENGVIMPLKIGNYWIYKVTEWNNDGTTKSVGYDTTYVIKDTLINGEKWFLTFDPCYSFNIKKVCLTNTDVGLYVNDMECFCYSLRAEYPAKHSSYLYSEEEERPVEIRTYSDDGNLIEQKTVNIRTNIMIDVAKLHNYQSTFGIHDSYSYITRLESKIDGKIANTTDIVQYKEYFVPDLGLIRKEYSTLGTDNNLIIYKLRELILTNVKI